MKIVVSGDKHLGLTTDGVSRLAEQAMILMEIEDVVRQVKPDLYVDLGDLFHSPRPAPEVYELAIHHLIQVSEKREEVRFLVGNHDKPTRGDWHALTPLDQVATLRPQVVIQRWPEVVDYQDVRVLYLPHVTAWEAAAEETMVQIWVDEVALEAVKERPEVPLVVFAHLEVPGVGPAVDHVQRDSGLRIPDCLLMDAGREVHIFAGHVHRREVVDSRVTVVGSALQVDFAEAGSTKGIEILEVG